MQYIKKIDSFELKDIFECGQCFRWNKDADDSYTGIFNKRILNVRKDTNGNIVFTGNATENEIENYFDLKRDYTKIKNDLSLIDDYLKQSIEYGSGIRILNQDLFETIISFIISANNNIPRIKGCIESLCRNLGEYAGKYGGKEWYSFPSPQVLAEASEEDLAPCRLGYRAKYLLAAGRQVTEAGEGALEKLASDELTADETIEELRRYTGVGPKVASCIALFAMGRMESFPIDVWVKRVMNQLYGIPEGDTGAMRRYAAEHFGQYGGIAQQYLFYYITHAR